MIINLHAKYSANNSFIRPSKEHTAKNLNCISFIFIVKEPHLGDRICKLCQYLFIKEMPITHHSLPKRKEKKAMGLYPWSFQGKLGCVQTTNITMTTMTTLWMREQKPWLHSREADISYHVFLGWHSPIENLIERSPWKAGVSWNKLHNVLKHKYI